MVWSKSIVDAAKVAILLLEAGGALSMSHSIALYRQAVLAVFNREFNDLPNQVASYKLRRKFRLSENIVSEARVWIAISRLEHHRWLSNQFTFIPSLRVDDFHELIPFAGMSSCAFSLGPVAFYVEVIDDYTGAAEAKGLKFSDNVLGFTRIPGSASEPKLEYCDDKIFERAAWSRVQEQNRPGFIPFQHHSPEWPVTE